jgi:hypothetical protein
MTCENQIGVKNVMLTFRDCDTDAVYGPISHDLATEELPLWRLCGFTNEAIPGGYVRRAVANQGVELAVIRDLRIPLAMYQGCSDVTLQVEYFNGLVYSGIEGTGVGDERSDTHEVTLDIAFREIDELLPVGQLEPTSVAEAA